MPVFKNKDLSLATERAVHRAVVLAVLLYGTETWCQYLRTKTSHWPQREE